MSSTGQTVEDLEDELDLQRAILQSLDESHSSRTDAAEQRLETLDAIKDLETKLARLRGHHAGGTPGCSLPVGQSLTSAQLDGLNFSAPSIPSSPPQFDRSAFSIPSRPRDSRLANSSEMFTIRKRRLSEDDTEDGVSVRSSKRTAGNIASPASTQVASSTPFSRNSPSDGLDSEFDVDDDILGILGLDGKDMRALQEEQRRAEQWLKERKEQERRDAEFARHLMSASPPAQTPSYISRAEPSTPARENPPSIPQLSSSNPLFLGTRPAGLSTAPSLNTKHALCGPHSEPSRSHPDSDDSDLAEISPRDFQSRINSNPRNTSRPSQYVPNRGNADPGIYNTAQSIQNPYAYHYPGPAAAHGSNGFGNSAMSMWPQPMPSAMAIYKGARNILSGTTNLFPSRMPLGNIITSGFLDDNYPTAFSGRDLR
jgi:hypothetical protein